MALDSTLLSILACPEDKTPVTLAADDVVAGINDAIGAGTLSNRGGDKVTEAIEAGLVREDGKYLYPVRDDIPVMLIEEAIELPIG